MTHTQVTTLASTTPPPTERQQLALTIAAECVTPGEFSTYGEIAFAAYGSFEQARTVGSAISEHGIARGSSILRSDRRVAPGYAWTLSDGTQIGPEMQRILFEHAGISFDESGQADPSRQVPLVVLLARAQQKGLITMRTLAERIAALADIADAR